MLPFGLINAGATFQRLVHQVLNGLQNFAKVDVNNVGVFSNTWTDHKKCFKIVSSKLKEAGLTINASKCKIGSVRVPYWEHWVGEGQISPDPW